MRKKNEPVIPAAKPVEVTAPRTASLRSMPTGIGPVPVMPPATRIQLTPVVQPVAFVPYSTQEQPLFTFDEKYAPTTMAADYYNQKPYEAPQAAPQVVEEAPAARRRFNFAALLVIVLCLLLAATVLLPKITDVLDEYLTLTTVGEEARTGAFFLDKLIDTAPAITEDGFEMGEFMECAAVILAVAIAALIALACLFRLKKRGFGKFIRVFAVLLFACAGFFVAIAIVNQIAEIGTYIFGGLAVLILAFAILVKTVKRKA